MTWGYRRRLRDRVAEEFRRHLNVWLDAHTLAKLGGSMAWHTRISGARIELQMRIENRVTRKGGRTLSQYCYRPNEDE